MKPSYLFVALASLFLLGLVRAKEPCQEARVLNCPLNGSPQDLVLKQQTFCPLPDTAHGLERQGMSCSSLAHCCSSYSQFDSKEGFRLIGVYYHVDPATGALEIPAGGKVRLEFVRETCLGALVLGTRGVQTQEQTKITAHYEKGMSPDKRSIKLAISGEEPATFSLPDAGCHLMALDLHAPKDAALTVTRADLCLMDAQLDACGVCNGNGQSCQSDRIQAQQQRRRLMTVATEEESSPRATVGPFTEGPVPADWVGSEEKLNHHRADGVTIRSTRLASMPKRPFSPPSIATLSSATIPA